MYIFLIEHIYLRSCLNACSFMYHVVPVHAEFGFSLHLQHLSTFGFPGQGQICLEAPSCNYYYY